MDSPASSDEIFFRLPDFSAHCLFKPAHHRNGDTIAIASDKWFRDGCRAFTKDMDRNLQETKGAQLAAYCYPECEDHRFRVICDSKNILFRIDDLSEDLETSNAAEVVADLLMNALTFPEFYRPTHKEGKEQPAEEPDVSRLFRDFWIRFSPDTSPGFQTRFAYNVELFLFGNKLEVDDRISGNIPSLASYIDHRLLSVGLKHSFDLIEYSLDMELPECVLEDTILETMKDHANKFIAWSNDIFSYNVEQSRGTTHNLITVLMKHHELDLQGAIDYAGNMCIEALQNYDECKARLPSFGPEIDRQVAAYVSGLESWISGSIEWSFASQRYFGDKGLEIREHRWVKLLPPNTVLAAAA